MEYHRHTIRLPNWDYSKDGYYFVTICSYKREEIFGEIKNDEMVLNDNGKIVNKIFRWSDKKGFDESNPYKAFFIDTFQIMPNHLHAIIICRGVIYHAQNEIDISKSYQHMKLIKNKIITLGQIIRYLKSKCSYELHKNGFNQIVWQRNYYEHIIRNEKELFKIQNYILMNPMVWDRDRNNPRNGLI